MPSWQSSPDYPLWSDDYRLNVRQSQGRITYRPCLTAANDDHSPMFDGIASPMPFDPPERERWLCLMPTIAVKIYKRTKPELRD